MANTTNFDLSQLTSQPANAEAYYNLMQAILDALIPGTCVSATTTAQPGSPTEEQVYVLTAAPTGTNWSGQGGKVAVFVNSSWYFSTTPKEGWTFWAQDDDAAVRYDGTAWVRFRTDSVQTPITASTTQTQAAATQLTSEVCHVTTANVNDAVKLPSASKGMSVFVSNFTGVSIQVFPSSGDKIDGGTVDVSINLASAKRQLFKTVSAVDWFSILGA